jgi:hypothetical protein
MTAEIDRETCLTECYPRLSRRCTRAAGENPPLPSAAPATPENIQKRKDWLKGNKDRAVFVQRPVQPFELAAATVNLLSPGKRETVHVLYKGMWVSVAALTSRPWVQLS